MRRRMRCNPKWLNRPPSLVCTCNGHGKGRVAQRGTWTPSSRGYSMLPASALPRQPSPHCDPASHSEPGEKPTTLWTSHPVGGQPGWQAPAAPEPVAQVASRTQKGPANGQGTVGVVPDCSRGKGPMKEGQQGHFCTFHFPPHFGCVCKCMCVASP